MSRLRPIPDPGPQSQAASDRLKAAGMNPDRVESLWGVKAKAKGGGALGLTAALWSLDRADDHEINRPACDQTHVISIWTKGSVSSELSIDGKPRFHRLRSRGTFQMARAGESVRVVLREPSGACLDLYLPRSILADCFESEFETTHGALELRPVGLETDPVITRLGDDIAAEIQTHRFASRMAIDGATLMLAANLVRRWSNQAVPIRQPNGGLAPWQVRRATDYIEANLARDIPLADLAALARLSPFHFARAFKRSVGQPPHAYQYGLRLERAKDLLAQTDLSITEIASQVGYEAPQTLARAFQRGVGVTPTAYRRDRRA